MKQKTAPISVEINESVHIPDVRNLRVQFGPHHFLEIVQEGDSVQLAIGATHQRIRADASTVGSQLEELVDELRRSHPGIAF
jgi:hypothetical protein